MTGGRRRFPPKGRLTVCAGTATRTAEGREAAMLAEFMIRLDEIRGVAYGTVCFDVTPEKVTLRLVRTYQPVNVEEAKASEEG